MKQARTFVRQMWWHRLIREEVAMTGFIGYPHYHWAGSAGAMFVRVS
jgi:hypothetical protein